MAQVIDCYSAKAGGSSTMYYYRYPDNTSEATRIYTGEMVYLSASYLQGMTGSMYPMVDPWGWIPWYHVQDIQPVYRTVTDACTAPENVSIQNGILTIEGGNGGDLNALTGFGVSYRERAISSVSWGEWSMDTAVAERSIPVSASTGTVRQYRVRTLGEAGTGFYSEYTVCETLITGNAPAGTPVILLPLSGMDTYASVCAVRIMCPAEADGDTMTLQRSLDGGAWTDVASVSGSGGTVFDVCTPEIGPHVLRYRLLDANGVSGGEDSISFVRNGLFWYRPVSAGDIIANPQISFLSDLYQMYGCVVRLCAFYGRPQIVLPGTPGHVADWHKQLLAMQEAVDGCRRVTGREPYGFERPAGWPSAYRITQLREAIQNT